MTNTRRTRNLAGLTAALVAASLMGGAATTPAHAGTPTLRVVADAREPAKAYDILRMTLRSSPRANRPAVVMVTHARKVTFGDAVDVWIDLDQDAVPDLHLTGSAFSEYLVYEAKSFTKDGKDISALNCASLAMAGDLSKVRFDPQCLGASSKFSVAVKSSSDGEPATTDDWVPKAETLSKKVLASVPS